MSDAPANNQELHQSCVERFIDIANAMQRENIAPELISSALMTASGIYTTFTVAGNGGGLHASGVDKVVTRYRQTLEHIQERKREELGQAAG